MTRWTSAPLAAPRGNQVFSGRNPFRWPDFDRLPAMVRQVIDYAPVSLGSTRATEALRGGATVEAVARVEIAMARKFSRDETLALYGPDHPALQARRDA